MTTGEPTYRTNDPRTDRTSGQTDGLNTSDTPSMASQAQQKVGQATDQAKQAISQVSDQAQQQATSQLAQRKDQATQGLNSVAQALEQVGEQLRHNDQPQLGQYANMAAGQLNRVSGYLREHSVNDLVGEVERLARRQPEVFLAGAFILGVLGARFMKASSGQTTSSPSSMMSSGQGMRPAPWGNTGRPSTTTTNPPWRNQGTPYGAYDPGSTGTGVREYRQ
ncbi:MAG: hypothetical protein IVW57_03650 [Ktedonobacterales bacterium]|nr:hypothetical protein [Ktedonobacterales bacterium]